MLSRKLQVSTLSLENKFKDKRYVGKANLRINIFWTRWFLEKWRKNFNNECLEYNLSLIWLNIITKIQMRFSFDTYFIPPNFTLLIAKLQIVDESAKIIKNLRLWLSSLWLETKLEQSKSWDTIWTQKMKQLKHWIKIKCAWDKAKRKLRCIRVIDGVVSPISKALTNGMTVFLTSSWFTTFVH